jgi:hypothetical protein
MNEMMSLSSLFVRSLWISLQSQINISLNLHISTLLDPKILSGPYFEIPFHQNFMSTPFREIWIAVHIMFDFWASSFVLFLFLFLYKSVSQRDFRRFFGVQKWSKWMKFFLFSAILKEWNVRGTIRNKNFLWQPCLLTDRNKMCNLNRGPSIDTSYQVSVHLAKQFQRRRFFRNRPIRKKNYL